MMMLNRNGMLDYAIVPPVMENEALCLHGENSLPQSALMDSEVASLCTVFENSWRKQEGQIVLVSSFCHHHMVVIPLQWEGSVVKLLAEFISLTNVIYDIPPMGAGAATSEILRRCHHLINKELNTHKREFSTPYCGFYHTHMTGFNQVVMNALAVPAGVSIKMLTKEGLVPEDWEFQLQNVSEGINLASLQWPFRLNQFRLIDQENQIFSFQMKEVLKTNVACKTPHVNLSRDGLFFYQSHQVPAKAVVELIQNQFRGTRRRTNMHNLHKTLPRPITDYEHVPLDRQVKCFLIFRNLLTRIFRWRLVHWNS